MSNSSNESDGGDICHDPVKGEVLQAHRIPLTAIAAVTLSCMISGSIFLLKQRKTFIFRRKAVQYLALATVGLMLYVKDSLTIIWTYPRYDCDLQSYMMYYLGAAPIHVIPIFLRSWRIYCIYRETLNINCTYDTLLSAKVRRHKWMWTRIAVAYIPFLVVAPFVMVNENLTYYIWICVEGVYGLANLILALRLYFMRSELQEKFIDETRSLILYAVIAFIEIICSNILYISSTNYKNSLIVVYLYVDLTLVSLMWFLTGGKAVYQIWKRKGHRESKFNPRVGQLDTEAIERAKQLIELNLTATATMSSASV